MTTIPDEGPISIDQAVELLSPEENEDDAGEVQEEEAGEEKDAGDTDDEASESDKPGEEDEDSDDEDEGAEPALAPPSSWSKEDKPVWDGLKPEQRAVIARREADRDKATAEAVQRAGQFGAHVKQIADKYQEVAPQLEDGFQARWGEVDWVKLAQEASAEEYNSIKAQMDAEKKQLDDFKVETAKASQAAYAQFLQEEGPKLQQLAPEIAEPGEQRTKLVKFLTDAGFEPTQLRYASAAELSIAYDAMRYREARANAKAKAAEPKKQPAAAAPKVVKATPAGASKSQDAEIGALRKRVTQTRSVDAALDFLDAKAKRVSRKR